MFGTKAKYIYECTGNSMREINNYNPQKCIEEPSKTSKMESLSIHLRCFPLYIAANMTITTLAEASIADIFKISVLKIFTIFTKNTFVGVFF